MKIKKYMYFLKIFLLNYKNIFISFLLSIFIIVLINFTSDYFSKRQYLFEKFDMGIVIDDDEKYISLILNMIQGKKEFSNSFSLIRITEDEAEQLLNNNEIPCYIIIPEGFTKSIIDGTNKDIIFVGNREDNIKYSLSKSLIKAGTAFISSSQSGIYATLDYAYKNNIDKDTINNKIVEDINLSFAKALLGYENYYKTTTLYPAGVYDLKTHYIYSFLIFLLIIFGINFYEPIRKIIKSSDKFSTVGVNNLKLIFYMSLTLFFILSIFAVPIILKFGIINIFLVINIASLIIFSGIVFENKVSNGIFLFSSGLIMLVFSGGIIPKALMPSLINKFSFLTINHYFVMNRPFIEIFIYTITFSLFLFFLSKIFSKKINMKSIKIKSKNQFVFINQFRMISLIITRIKLILKPSLVFSLLLVPIVGFLIISNLDLEKEMKVNVGVVFENEKIKNNYNINYYFYDTINLIEFENEESLINNINNYNADCGYVFMDTDNYKRSIKLYKTPTTTTDKIMNLFLSSILIQERSGEFGYKAVKNYVDVNKNIIEEEILNKTYSYTQDGSMINVEYRDISNKINTYTYKTSFEKIFFTIISSMCIFFSILTNEIIINEKNKEVFFRIKIIDNKLKKYYLTYFFSLFIINLSYLSIATILIKLLFNNLNNILNILFVSIIFSFVVSILSIIFSKKIKSNKYILSISIFVFLFSIVFSEGLFYIKDIIKFLEPLKYVNLVFYYIKGLNI